MIINSKDLFKQSHLAHSLVPITIRELFHLPTSPCDFYIFDKVEFKHLIHKGQYLSQKLLKDTITSGHTKIFTNEHDRKIIIQLQQDNLRSITRSFSMGKMEDNCKKQLGLLVLNLRYLFEDPTNDETLNLQHQSLKVLFKYLYNNPKHHESIYLEFKKQGHHYIFSQPFLSSLFLLGILKTAHIYSEKEIENLFIASYFKDIGMSAIPVEKYDTEELLETDKKTLLNHPKLSVQILQNRIQFAPHVLKAIEEHHNFSTLQLEDGETINSSKVTITGFETTMMIITDIVAAMISTRPYREATTLFEALELIKNRMSTQYPKEFKLIVNYFKNFFSNIVR